jgi:hypothetical protein
MSILKVKHGIKDGRYYGKFTPPSGGLITVYADNLMDLMEEVNICLMEETEKISIISYTPDND